MSRGLFAALGAGLLWSATWASAQRPEVNKKEAGNRRFEESKPAVGDLLPNVEIYRANGAPLATRQLRGSYTVLVFGCLT